MASCRKYNACLPANMHAAVQAEAEAEARVILAGLQRCAPAGDMLGTAHFLKRLRRFLFLKYQLPLEDRSSIVHLILPRITDPNMQWDKAEFMVSTLGQLINGEKDRLPEPVAWRPLYDLVDRVVFPGARDLLARPFRDEHGHRLRDLVLALRRSFAPNAPTEILAEVRPMLCPHTHTMYRGMGYISLFLPVSEAHDHGWLPEVLGAWCTITNTPFWDSIILSLLSRLAQDKPYQVDWMPHLPLIFGQLLRICDLPIGRGGVPTAYTHTAGSAHVAMFGPAGTDETKTANGKTSQSALAMKFASRLIVWMLDGEEALGRAAEAHLRQLMRSLEGFYHPSTVQDRANALGSLLVSLPHEMIRRIKKEVQRDAPSHLRLQQRTRDAVVDMWTPIVLTSMSSKSRTLVRHASGALEYLAVLSPGKLFPPLLERASLVFTLSGSPALKICMLGALQGVLNPLLHYDTTGQHLVELLPQIADGIDPNDPTKARAALSVLYTLASQVVFSEQGCGQRTHFQYAVEDFVVSVLTRSLEFFSSLASSGTLLKLNPVSSYVVLASRMTFEVFFQALSRPLLQRCSRMVLQAFCSSIHGTPKPMLTLVRGLCAADPAGTLRLFVPATYEALVRGGKLVDDVTDKELCWNVGVLAGLCASAGVELLKYQVEIETVLFALWESTSKLRIKLGSKLLKRVLYCLTLTYYQDVRLVPGEQWHSPEFQADHGRFWGHRCALAETRVAWHVPSLPEVQWAVRLFNRCFAASAASLEAALAGHGAVADAVSSAEDDVSQVNRCRLALKQLKKLVASALTLLDPLPDAGGPGSDGSGPLPAGPGMVPYERVHCNTISRLDFGKEQPLAALQYTRQDVCDIVCRVIEAGLPAPDVDVMGKCCRVLHLALLGVGMGSMKGQQVRVSIQTLKQFKETELGKRQARNYHVLRSFLQMCQRGASRGFTCHSDVHERCHRMLLRLATGPYAEVRKRAQRVLRDVMPSAPNFVRHIIIADVIRGLVTAKDADQMRGTIHLLRDVWTLKKISRQLDLVGMFMEQIIHAKEFPDEPGLRGKVDDLHEQFRTTFRGLQIAGDSKRPCQELLQEYNALLDRLVVLAREEGLPWQRQLMIVYDVRMLVAYLPLGFPDYRLPSAVLEFCLAMPLQDQPVIRRVAVSTLQVLLKRLKPLPRRTAVPREAISPSGSAYFTPEDVLQLCSHNPTSVEEYGKCVFIDKVAYGYCALPLTLSVIDYSKLEVINDEHGGLPSQLSEFAALVHRVVTPERMGRLLDLLCIDKSASTGFDDYAAQMFKGLFQVAGVRLLATMTEALERHMQAGAQASRATEESALETPQHDEAAHYGVVVEVISGLTRASRHWGFEDVQTAWRAALALWQTAMERASPAGYGAFLSWIRWVTCDMDPRRSGPLKEQLMGWLGSQNPTEAAYAITTHHRVLQSVTVASAELAWRDPVFQLRVAEAAVTQLNSPYQQVRNDLGMLLAALYSYLYRSARGGTYTITADRPEPVLAEYLRSAIDHIKSDEADVARLVSKTVLTMFSKTYDIGGTHPMQPYSPLFFVAAVEAFNRWYDETDAPAAALMNTVVMQLAAITYSEDLVPQMVGLVCVALQPLEEPPCPPPGASDPAPPLGPGQPAA
eukprot:EG_transcript_290